MEQTLAIIKPDAMNLKVADHIIKAIEAAGFFIVGAPRRACPLPALDHLREHRSLSLSLSLSDVHALIPPPPHSLRHQRLGCGLDS